MDAVTLAMIKGLGGGGSSLPSVTSSDNGKVLAVKNGAWAAGERNYVVTITYNSGYSADKTYAEIVDAIHAGFSVIAEFAGEWYILTYVNESQTIGTICFSSIYGSYNTVSTISISRTNTVTKKTEKNFLPLVSSSDNGSELIVKNGNWAKQQKKFIVTLTPTAQDFSGTMDKTVAEINAAYEAGQEIWFKVAVGSDWTEYPLSRVGKLNEYEYPSFNCNALYDEADVLVMIYTGTTDNGTKQTYSTKIYSLTPAS